MSVDYQRLVTELAAYEIGEELSRGTWGIMLAGRHRQLGHQVAITQLPLALAADPLARARFVTEVRVLAAHGHPHLASIYDLVEQDGLCLLVMERLTGGALWDRFTSGALGPEAACAAILAACAGLEHAHRHGVLHRDLGPQSLVFSSVGVLKVTGLGLGACRAPERANGEVSGPAADAHAAAAVLFQMLSGQLPEPRRLSGVAAGLPAGVAGVTMRALHPDPRERYPSAEAFGVALAQAAAAGWGSGWLATTGITVAAPGSILAAALGGGAPRESAGAHHLAGVCPAGPSPVRKLQAVAWIARRLRSPGALAALLALAAVAVIGVALLTRPASAPVAMAGGRMPPASLQQSVQAPAGSRADPVWRALRDAPIARQQIAVAVQDGVIWVFGGLVGDHATATVAGYDPPIDTWKTGPDLPIPLHNAMAVSYRGELVVLGGWQPEGSNLTAITSSRVFALRNGAWVELPELNWPRAAGAAAVVGDRIVVVGGQANGGLVSTTEVFDGTRWVGAAPIPTPREHLAAASYGRFIYAVGGRALSSDRNSAAMERYDPLRDEWERLPPMPTARGGLGAAVVDGRLIAVGGEQPTGVFDTVQAYDIASSSWSELAPLRTPRHGLGAAAVGSSLYAISGADRPTYAESSATTEVLTIPRRPT